MTKSVKNQFAIYQQIWKWTTQGFIHILQHKKTLHIMLMTCFSWWRWSLLTYEEFLPKPDEEDSILNNIWRSDELCFQFNSKIKRHHCVYWTEENQRVTAEKEVNLPGIIVWAATFSLGIIGPFFSLRELHCRKLPVNFLLAQGTLGLLFLARWNTTSLWVSYLSGAC